MKKKKMISYFFIFIAIVVIAVRFHSRSAQPDVDVVVVQTAAVKENALPLEVRAIGTLVAHSVEITPEVAGHVDNILFRDGTFVKRDDPLIQLDDAVYKAKNDSANAQFVFSQNDFKRKSLLVKQGAIAKQAVDQAEADLKEKKASAKENEVMLSKMKLTAPFDGVVGKTKVNRGDYVTVGQGLVTLTDTKHLHIEYNVPEKYLPFLKLGQEVKITSSTYPGKTFTGTLAFISPTVSIENRSFSLYAEVPNETNLLAAGMFVNVTQSLGSEEHALTVPARSLVPVLDGEQVYKVVDGKAVATPVSIGKRTTDTVQVTQGLALGDVVITDGQMKVKNGMAVKING